MVKKKVGCFIKINLICIGLLVACISNNSDFELYNKVLEDYEFPENCKILDETVDYNDLNLSIEEEKLTRLKLQNDKFDLDFLLEQEKESFSKLDYSIRLKFELVSEDKFPEIWRIDSSFKGLIRLGKPLYSINGHYAYVECFYKCRGNCGFQLGTVYKKENNGWKKWKELHYGISSSFRDPIFIALWQ